MERNSNLDLARRAFRCAVWFLLAASVAGLGAEPVVFHLKNGDRIAGTIVSQTTNAVVVTTPWAKELSIPLNQIERREPPASATPTNAIVAQKPTKAAKPPPQKAKPVVAAAHPKPVKPKTPSTWRANVKLGMDLIYGSRDRQIYYGQFSLTYARPYKSNPKKYFRNITEYRLDYAKTDGIESANRMYGSDKTDFDIGSDVFVYNLLGIGYDDVRKINLQYEAGPGLGYHLFKLDNFVANVEAGLNYQYQDRRDASRIDTVYGRAAQDITWKIVPRITLTQRASLLTRLDSVNGVQLRAEANVALGLVKDVSLNLTAIDLYDTRPVAGVTPNEFQLRSSVGIAF